MKMNPAKTYNDFIERYGEKKGKEMFLDLCDEKVDREPFPMDVHWIEIRKEILNREI